jgi:hypothetical protein
MATKTPLLTAALLSLSLLGGKCKGPKPPKAEAADAVEEAFWAHDVERAIDAGDAMTVDVDMLTGPDLHPAWATVTFTRSTEAIHATLVVDERRHDFVISEDGQALEPTADRRR